MHISILLGGEDSRYGPQLFDLKTVINGAEMIVTCLKGEELADFLKGYPTALVTIYYSPKQGETILLPTLEALPAAVRDNLYIVLPTERHLNWVGTFPHSRTHGARSNEHFRLYIAELLEQVGVSNANHLTKKAVLAVMDP